MKKLLYSFALVLFAGNIAWAQSFCATDYYHQQLVAQDPNLAKDLDRLLANARSKSDDSTVFVVPVVFHVLHRNGIENISDAQIFDAMEVLNRDFRKQNADTANILAPYQALATDIKIEFKLAAYDPVGNCTNGINRIYTHETQIGDAASKLNQWDRSRYLNVWVVSSIDGSPTTAGYAHFPTDVGGLAYWRDGLVLRHNYIGRIGTGSEGGSRTLTHEVAHWIALPHTWGRTNDPGVSCGDDGANDTPITKGHNSCSNRVSVTCDNNAFSNSTYNFNGVTTSSGDVDTTATPNQIVLNNTRIEFSSFKAVGVSANSAKNESFSFTDWDGGATNGETVYANLTGAINLNKYYEFTITPQTLQAMSLLEISFRIGRNDTGARTFVVRSSVSNYTTNLTAVTTPTTHAQFGVMTGNVFFMKNDTEFTSDGAKVTVSGAPYTGVFTPITFRIYAYNAEDPTGTFEVDNVRATGTFGTIENVENYMEYAFCSKMFTPDQAAIMRNTLQGDDAQRKNLITAATHQFTGIDLTTPPVCVPIVDIKANKRNTCVGQSVTFTDQSYNGPVTFREWTFQDGSPATSTSANPSVSFTSHGVKTVTLTVGNASGQVTKTFTQYIDVQPDWAAYTGPKSFNLEPANQYQELRLVNDGNTYSKFVPYPIGYDSGNSLKLTVYKDLSGVMSGTQESRYYENLGGQVDAIITPTFDLRNSTDVTFSFDYSYATNASQTSLISENIRVYYSRNCGESWVPLGNTTQSTIEKAALTTAGFAGNIDFIPTSDSDWGHYSRPFNVNTTLDDKTRFKIEFTASDYSSNLYIDNIMVSGVVGLADNFTAEHELIIAPNPVVSGNNLNIQYVAGSEPVTFILRNLQGEEIASVVRNEVNQPVSFGFEISDKIAAAYYFLEVKSTSSNAVKKIAVIK
jgi:PKD repeat protein